jgi:hypothetical protein
MSERPKAETYILFLDEGKGSRQRTGKSMIVKNAINLIRSQYPKLMVNEKNNCN